MRDPIILTGLLLLAGVFTLWCSARNYDWFFSYPGAAGAFIKTFGRPNARIVYLIVSVGLLLWGVGRIIHPPREIPFEFVYELAKPESIDLLSPATAGVALKQSDQIYGLQVVDGTWSSFWAKLPKDHPSYRDAADSAVAGPNFREGFALRSKTIEGVLFEGRILYFNESLESCDNVIFSKRPLDSAAFVMVICSEEASAENGLASGLMVYFVRNGSPMYDAVTK